MTVIIDATNLSGNNSESKKIELTIEEGITMACPNPECHELAFPEGQYRLVFNLEGRRCVILRGYCDKCGRSGSLPTLPFA
jgi:hypothetical protein